MLKSGEILNPSLLAVLARAGHTELIFIADSGLPIPRGPELIDLSLVAGVLAFLQVVEVVKRNLVIESALVAREARSAPTREALAGLLNRVPIEEVSHEDFKRRLPEARAVIRTGECTPYANVGLVAGVPF